jgi:hypothetical protein
MRSAVILTVVLLAAVGKGQQPVWREIRSMPVEPSGEGMRFGAWLASVGSGDELSVYAAKGNFTADFYRYRPSADSWCYLGAIPRGNEGVLPEEGCRGVSDGVRYLYMPKGNRSDAFWRFDTEGESWKALANVPNPDTLGYARDLAIVRSVYGSHVYLLWGTKGKFFRYDIADTAWELLQSPPVGEYDGWRAGSWLVHDGLGRLFAHKSYEHELWVYDVHAGAWIDSMRAPMPYIGNSGRFERSRFGGCAAMMDECIYALKGGHTQEFWRYDPSTNAWTELDTMPALGSSGHRSGVSRGGHLIAADDRTLLATKGRYLELWRYGARPGVAEGEGKLHRTSPEVLLGTPEGDFPTSGRVLDIQGRDVTEKRDRLSPGVYFLAERSADSEERPAVVKVVIQR